MWVCFNTKFSQICIQNNPEEARQMLLQNPQLAYALLQAQVVMKIVDPVIAQVGFLLYPSDCNISMYIFHTACYFQVWWYCVFLEHSPSISLVFQNNTTVYYLELSLEPTKWIWNVWQGRPKWSFLLEVWQCLFSYLPVTLSPLDQVMAKSFVTLTLKSYVDEMVWCYHSNEKS